MPTPKATHEKRSLSELLKKLAEEGLEVARAELDLAHAEAAGLAKQYVTGVVICLTSFALAIAAFVILSQALAIALEPYFNSPAVAYLIAGLAMMIITIFLGWLGVSFLTRKYKPVGTIFKWLNGRRRTS